MSIFATKLRTLVSQDRVRHEEMSVNVDLTYITDRVVAMSFPATGIEAAWRNDIQDVCRLLRSKHKNKFLVFNLSERDYEYDLLDNQIVCFPFKDHHAPPLHIIFQIIFNIDSWLKANDEHVAVVHCIGGKGRTGLIIVCYLYYCGMFPDVDKCLEYFASRRSAKAKGVTQPSQLRYVRYFCGMISNKIQMSLNPLVLTEVSVGPVPKGFYVYVEFYPQIYAETSSADVDGLTSENLIYSTFENVESRNFGEDSRYSSQCSVELSGDILVRGYILGQKEAVSTKGKTPLFRMQFHTGLVHHGEISIPKSQLDDLDKEKKKFQDFELRLTFSATDCPRNSVALYNMIFNQMKTAFSDKMADGTYSPPTSPSLSTMENNNETKKDEKREQEKKETKDKKESIFTKMRSDSKKKINNNNNNNNTKIEKNNETKIVIKEETRKNEISDLKLSSDTEKIDKIDKIDKIEKEEKTETNEQKDTKPEEKTERDEKTDTTTEERKEKERDEKIIEKNEKIEKIEEREKERDKKMFTRKDSGTRTPRFSVVGIHKTSPLVSRDDKKIEDLLDALEEQLSNVTNKREPILYKPGYEGNLQKSKDGPSSPLSASTSSLPSSPNSLSSSTNSDTSSPRESLPSSSSLSSSSSTVRPSSPPPSTFQKASPNFTNSAPASPNSSSLSLSLSPSPSLSTSSSAPTLSDSNEEPKTSPRFPTIPLSIPSSKSPPPPALLTRSPSLGSAHFASTAYSPSTSPSHSNPALSRSPSARAPIIGRLHDPYRDAGSWNSEAEKGFQDSLAWKDSVPTSWDKDKESVARNPWRASSPYPARAKSPHSDPSSPSSPTSSTTPSAIVTLSPTSSSTTSSSTTSSSTSSSSDASCLSSTSNSSSALSTPSDPSPSLNSSSSSIPSPSSSSSSLPTTNTLSSSTELDNSQKQDTKR